MFRKTSLIKKYFIIVLLPLITVILLSGCSNRQKTGDLIIIQGQVRLPESNLSSQNITTTELDYPGEGHTDTAADALTDINIIPLHSNYSDSEYKDIHEYLIKLDRALAKDYLNGDEANFELINSKILNNRGRVLKEVSPGIYKVKINNPDKKVLDELAARAVISKIEPDHLVHIQVVPDDPAFHQQWNLSMLELSQTWERYKGDKSITVAVIDSGILPDHPDLQGNIIQGYDFIDNDSHPLDTDPNFSHGTHVAGIIAAVSNNGEGIAGINWNIQIMPIRVIAAGGSGNYSTLISGINWAVDNGADIINLSLAGPVDSEMLQEAIQRAVNKGITIIAAAGNNGSAPVLYPARYPEVIAVGAVGPDKNRAFYSNYGPELDLVAPGGVSSSEKSMILSTSGYMSERGAVHKYTWAQGTSMAAPHVSGLVALLYSSGVRDPLYIREHLKNTADDLGVSGEDNEYGAGLVNINRALGINNNNRDDLSQLPEKTKIIVRPIDNPSLETVSVSPDHRGNFSLEIRPGHWEITGWIDKNDNELIDEGDYYYQRETELSRDSRIDIQLEKY